MVKESIKSSMYVPLGIKDLPQTLHLNYLIKRKREKDQNRNIFSVIKIEGIKQNNLGIFYNLQEGSEKTYKET